LQEPLTHVSSDDFVAAQEKRKHAENEAEKLNPQTVIIQGTQYLIPDFVLGAELAARLELHVSHGLLDSRFPVLFLSSSPVLPN